MTLQLSQAIENRLDALVNSDPGCVHAVDALYDVFEEVERRDDDLHLRLTDAFLDTLHAALRAAWLDGFAVGADPVRLVFADAALRHPDPAVKV